MSTAKGHQPPRMLIVAVPAGTYVMIRIVPENGWGPAAIVGALLAMFILWGPKAINAASKALAVRNATKQKKAAEKEKEAAK
ncbi:hypothetical protein QQY66_49080 [Streptomyces sp. DG2A-72]|uniref:hypothetical protein n=1 Tax=Streptomyces sp. DG2A-72 TaxID=3051386 RepID=UPI00265C35E8|nr:hypothetical protein [Streptomyces sp. DG2A-72]MDO0939268.1 hypothetical protein [Streptomyces sp. DG2A-72]